MRTKLIAGNWKMNKDIHETATLVEDLKKTSILQQAGLPVNILICPPFTSLVIAKMMIKEAPIKLGAQNMSQYEEGAYTGEVSAKMLKSIGCEYVILGHSERRQYFKETNELINLKAKQALKHGLTPIICVGETLEERTAGVTEEIIKTQVKGVLNEMTSDQVEQCVIAYEPVWAIGTGKTATTEQANDVHKFIRKLVGQLYSWATAEKLIIQYGGSMNDKNAAELLSQSDIDGGLIGGASLKADAFAAIITAGSNAMKG